MSRSAPRLLTPVGPVSSGTTDWAPAYPGPRRPSMSGTTEMRPFRARHARRVMMDLRRWVAATCWPSKELVADAQELGREGIPQPLLLPRSRQGGHFAAWEKPELFAIEIREAFKSLR
jgi:hypothetical protein